jgi:hypothetical protein
MYITELSKIVALPVDMSDAEKSITEPELDDAIAALKEPDPESLVLVTVIPMQVLTKSNPNKTTKTKGSDLNTLLPLFLTPLLN